MATIKTVMLQFGAFSCPVGIQKATEDRKKVSFNQGHKCADGTLHVIKQDKVCTGCNQTLQAADIIKLYTPTKGAAPIHMPDHELDALKVQGTDQILITEIVKPEILLADPIRFTGDTYYVQPPAKEKYPPQAYAVIYEALKGNIALGKTVLWNKDFQVALRIGKFGLVMDMLRFDSELRGEPSLTLPPVDATWVNMAKQAFEKYRVQTPTLNAQDTYNVALAKLCSDKVAGLPVAQQAPAPTPVLNTNIEQMLRATLAMGAPTKAAQAPAVEEQPAAKSSRKKKSA